MISHNPVLLQPGSDNSSKSLKTNPLRFQINRKCFNSNHSQKPRDYTNKQISPSERDPKHTLITLWILGFQAENQHSRLSRRIRNQQDKMWLLPRKSCCNYTDSRFSHWIQNNPPILASSNFLFSCPNPSLHWKQWAKRVHKVEVKVCHTQILWGELKETRMNWTRVKAGNTDPRVGIPSSVS